MSKHTQRVGQLLAVVARAAQTLATDRLEPLRLSPREWGVLSTLVESGPQTQIALANATATDRTAMVYLLDELERRGLVDRVRNASDRRSYLINLTRRGAALQTKAATELAGQTDKLLEPLTASERQQLVFLLGRIAEHWETEMESRDGHP